MVEIRYFESATSKDFETYWVKRLADFLREKEFAKDELLKLRFFKCDVLGEEINTGDLDFLDISEGQIEVFGNDSVPHGPLIPYIPYIIAAITFVAAIVLAPDPIQADYGSSKAKSATNALGASENEPRVNGRIDDIFGTVTRHTPPLWQWPYRIGVDNQEVEVLLTCVGRGRYDIDMSNLRDGDTPYEYIPNAKGNVYEPGTYPGNGSPSQILGGLIDQPIGIYRESNDLNASELIPPNDLAIGDAEWLVTSDSSGTGSYTLTLSNAAELEVALTDYFTVGQNLLMIDCVVGRPNGAVTLYATPGGGIDISHVFLKILLNDISGEYEISNVTADTLTVIDTNSLYDYTNLPFVGTVYNVTDVNLGVQLFYTEDEEIDNGLTWYQNENPYSDPVAFTTQQYNADVGQVFDNVIGPVTLPRNTEKIITNLTSSAGFYKLSGSTEVEIDAQVRFIIEELDATGSPTGNGFDFDVDYSTNPSNARYSVYQTAEIGSLYEYTRVSARRLTDRDKRDNISNVDKIEWTVLYTFESLPVGTDFGDVTLLHTYVPSNSQSRLTKKRRTNLDPTRKITEYLGNGTFGPTESFATDDFAQILIHKGLDRKIGRLSLENMNADNWLIVRDKIAAYFATLGDQMIRFGYDFDDTEMSYEDAFMMICNVMNCNPYVQNGKYDMFFEEPQTKATRQITCRNKLTNSETREDIFRKTYDGVEVTYRNEDTGVSETVSVPDDGTALNPERVELLGCVTEVQAYRKACRLRNKQIYHVVNTEFDVDEFARMIVPGERIDSPDGTRFVRHKGNTDGYRVYEGEVVEVTGLVVELSEPVLFTEGEDHYIQFTGIEGDNSELILCSEGDDEFFVVLNELPSEAIYDGYTRDRTKFTFCSEQLRESIALIPQTIDTKIDEGREINTVASINYDSRYYKDDQKVPS